MKSSINIFLLISLLSILILMLATFFVSFYTMKEWQEVFRSISSNLLCWFIIFIIMRIANQNNNIGNLMKKVNKISVATNFLYTYHNNRTEEIYRVVTKEKTNVLPLLCLRRDNLDREFYEKEYKKAEIIRIAGIALISFINNLTNKKELTNPSHLLNTFSSNNKEVNVLIADSTSDFVKNRKEQTPGKKEEEIVLNINNSLAKINNDLKAICESKYKKNFKGKLIIKKTKHILYSSYFNVEWRNEEDNLDGKLYYGFLFNHEMGDDSPLYEIWRPKENIKHHLYNYCINNFNHLFDNAITIFKWPE